MMMMPSRCEPCKVDIIWAATKRGRMVPVEPVDGGGLAVGGVPPLVRYLRGDDEAEPGEWLAQAHWDVCLSFPRPRPDPDYRPAVNLVGMPYSSARTRASARLFPCALRGWRDACTGPDLANPRKNWMVWDHCHAHDLIRGALCARHNHMVARGWHVADSEVVSYLRGCPGCAPITQDQA